jgi:hypothetical protein
MSVTLKLHNQMHIFVRPWNSDCPLPLPCKHFHGQVDRDILIASHVAVIKHCV